MAETDDVSSVLYVFSYINFVYALSGAVASVLAMVVFYPLDTVRSILQIEDKRPSHNTVRMIREIVQEEGVKRLYRGLQPVLTTIWISSFIYFYVYHVLKSVFRDFYGLESSGTKDLFVALIAGSMNVLVTCPLWVVAARMKFQGCKIKATWHDPKQYRDHYKGLVDGMIQIAHHEGVASLWNGVFPSLLLVLNPGIQFMTYEIQKRQAQYWFESVELRGIVYFMMGAVAKTVSTFATYPLQVVQSRFRYKDEDSDRGATNALFRSCSTLYRIFTIQGFRGLYKGLEAKLSQTILTAALMFLCYEKISAFVFRVMGVEPHFRPAKS